jgi:hypothetical protein
VLGGTISVDIFRAHSLSTSSGVATCALASLLELKGLRRMLAWPRSHSFAYVSFDPRLLRVSSTSQAHDGEPLPDATSACSRSVASRSSVRWHSRTRITACCARTSSSDWSHSSTGVAMCNDVLAAEGGKRRGWLRRKAQWTGYKPLA